MLANPIRPAAISILIVGTFSVAACELDEESLALGDSEQAVLDYNWVSPNWVSPNWVSPNWVSPNWVSPNWVSPNGTEHGNYTFAGLSFNPAFELGLSIDGAGLDEVALDGLVVNGDLTVNGQDFTGEQESNFSVLFSYLVQCALAPSQSVDITTSRGDVVTVHGAMNLAPEWAAGPLSSAGQQYVSACIAARSNAQGKRVHISLRGGNIQTSATERATFAHPEGGFFGTIFGDQPQVNTCAAQGGGVAGRQCADGACGFVDAGPCADLCSGVDADGAFSSCGGALLITTYLPMTDSDSFADRHSCSIAGGVVSCSGDNQYGQLGDGTTTDSAAALAVDLDGVPAAEVVGGEHHTCARLRTGAVRCWGDNRHGQAGEGNDKPSLLEPSSGEPLLVDAMSLRSGANHTCALEADGSVLCWGENSHGQLGDGGTADSHVPVILATDEVVLAIASGNGADHSCAVTAIGGLQCWGKNDDGQLGDESKLDRTSPVDVTTAGGTLFGDVVAACTGERFTCALQSSGTVSCFGDNVASDAPVAMPTVHSATAIDCSASAICAQLADGSTQCW